LRSQNARQQFHFRFGRIALLALCINLPAAAARAERIEVPLRLEQAFLQRLLSEQVYTDAGGEARVWDDGRNCNSLTLSAPQLEIAGGRVHTMTAARARIGTPVAGLCLAVADWNGFIDVFQEPVAGGLPETVEFRVVDSRIRAADGRSRGVLGTLWDWIKAHVHPRFHRLRIDLQPLMDEMRGLFHAVFPGDPHAARRLADSLALAGIGAVEGGIELRIRFDAPDRAAGAPPATPAPAMSAAELSLWEQSWQRWDAFLTAVIRQAGADIAQQDIRIGLLAVLLDARQDLVEVLMSDPVTAGDPVPALFVQAWDSLAPELRRLAATLPAAQALKYLGFIAGADALAAIRAAESAGFELSADALRRMARMITAVDAPDPLHYDTGVDARLRELFGFGSPLPDPEGASAPPAPRPIHAGIPGAMQLMFLPGLLARDSAYRVLVERLSGRVPTLGTLNEYLPQVQLLLDIVARSMLRARPIDPAYESLYLWMVPATAWQESCWRQFVRSQGEVRPIRSHAGAVGIMQVNPHVWRGFYDIDGLQHNVGYNAEAGSEILRHYLVDYAIARGEHEQPGGIDNLARAAYAMYNGGPRHISRYRRDTTSGALRAIDGAFWEKFQAVRAGNLVAVASCYTG
jgi:hypothetical protein